MKISELFRSNSQQSQQADQASQAEANKADQQRRTNDAKQSASEDTVSISPLARQLKMVSGILEEDETNQQNRIEDIKARIADGTYEVDSKDVVRSLASFAAGS